MKNSTSPAGRRPPIGAAGRVLLVAAVAAAAVTGLGVGAASASASDPSAYSVEAFRETIKPWDSITIPALACPTGSLQGYTIGGFTDPVHRRRRRGISLGWDA